MKEKQINDLLEKLADQLGTNVQYLWGVLIKQAYISFITGTILIFAMVGAWIVWFKTLKWMEKQKKEEKYFEEDTYTVILVVSGLILLATSFFLASFLNIYLASILNPEYWALNKILSLLGD